MATARINTDNTVTAFNKSTNADLLKPLGFQKLKVQGTRADKQRGMQAVGVAALLLLYNLIIQYAFL